jgi:hypothetical protein
MLLPSRFHPDMLLTLDFSLMTLKSCWLLFFVQRVNTKLLFTSGLRFYSLGTFQMYKRQEKTHDTFFLCSFNLPHAYRHQHQQRFIGGAARVSGMNSNSAGGGDEEDGFAITPAGVESSPTGTIVKPSSSSPRRHDRASPTCVCVCVCV